MVLVSRVWLSEFTCVHLSPGVLLATPLWVWACCFLRLCPAGGAQTAVGGNSGALCPSQQLTEQCPGSSSCLIFRMTSLTVTTTLGGIASNHVNFTNGRMGPPDGRTLLRSQGRTPLSLKVSASSAPALSGVAPVQTEINYCTDQSQHSWCSGDSVRVSLEDWAFSPSWPAPTPVLLGQPLSLVPTLSPNHTPPTPFPAGPAAADSSSGSRALWAGATAEP